MTVRRCTRDSYSGCDSQVEALVRRSQLPAAAEEPGSKRWSLCRWKWCGRRCSYEGYRLFGRDVGRL